MKSLSQSIVILDIAYMLWEYGGERENESRGEGEKVRHFSITFGSQNH